MTPAVYRTLLPRERVRAVDWAEKYVPAPSIIAGRLRFDLFPYCAEVLDCLDDPAVEIVTLMWAARCGKTTAIQAWLLKEIATNPHSAIWAEPDLPSLKRVFARTHQMIDGCPPCAAKCAPARLRSNTELRFEDCRVFGAYSGSPSSAADLAAQIACLNELDKYSHRRRLDRDGQEAGEADFPALVRDRTIGHANAKVVQMSTPTIKGRSRIEAELMNGDQRRFYVPCPHCSHYQTLRTGRSREEAGGIKFEKGKDGKLCPDTARRTAWYECEACRKQITDDQRYAMINAGKWVRAGQTIDKLGRIRGEPLRDNRHASFGPLGTHYSLLPGISWGMIAAEYVSELTNPLKSTLQNYLNSIEGVTFDPAPPETTPHELARRLAGVFPRGTLPPARFVTLGVDTGVSGTELIFYWMAVAWSNEGGGHVVDWGAEIGETDWWAKFDQLAGLGMPMITGIDSGGTRDEKGDAVTERVYGLCKNRRNVWPVKGSSTSWPSTDWYQFGFQRTSATPKELKRKRKAGIGDLLIMSTPISQSWREALCYGRLRSGEAGFVTLPLEVGQAPEAFTDFLDELISDVQLDGKWKRRGPNEFGDTLRICRTMAEVFTRGGKLWGMLPEGGGGNPAAAGSADEAGRKSFVRKMGGRSFQKRF